MSPSASAFSTSSRNRLKDRDELSVPPDADFPTLIINCCIQFGPSCAVHKWESYQPKFCSIGVKASPNSVPPLRTSQILPVYASIDLHLLFRSLHNLYVTSFSLQQFKNQHFSFTKPLKNSCRIFIFI